MRPTSPLIGRTIGDIRLRDQFGLNMLALSREGRQQLVRLHALPIRAGDVLLLQGSPAEAAEFAGQFGLVPLARRALTIPSPAKALGISLIMAASVLIGALGIRPPAVAFSGGVVAAVVFNIVPARRMYDAIDWPVIVLPGALMPVAGAMATSGAADWLARGLVDTLAGGRPVLALVLVLVVTMCLSDFMNNVATAAVMCPIAVGIAQRMGVRADPYLMAVAIAASCAFLTPIGHQSDTLILGPGGFRFGDYWRPGLPMELLVPAVSIPVLLVVWPP